MSLVTIYKLTVKALQYKEKNRIVMVNSCVREVDAWSVEREREWVGGL